MQYVVGCWDIISTAIEE